jgi:UDP-3-O-[3-hydroxymyristoyl] N-acetylglucosamine deacetylase
MVLPWGLKQRTLRKRVSLAGIGVHSGRTVGITLCPADAGTGIVFQRVDVPDSAKVDIPALSRSVGSTELSTSLGDPEGVCVATVEHLLAALTSLGVDNALVEVDGPEVPVMDGSARVFVEAIDQVGLVEQKASKRFIRIVKPVRMESGSAYAEFLPYNGSRLEICIDFDCAVIGRQALALELTPASFRKEIAGARTFGYLGDVERLWAKGLALGSSLENSVVIGKGAIVNAEGLRYPDEFVRHKALDAIGDLALAGAPIRGFYRSYRGGHKLNAAALHALISDRSAWVMVNAEEREERRRPRIHPAAGILVPAFAAEVA